MNKPRCGAKTRDGTPCQQYPLQGKTRCKLHGGKSTGAGAGNQNASTHGIYKSVLSEEEQARWHDIEIGRLDDELRLWRTRLLRALAAEQAARDKPELEEIIARKAGGQEQPGAEKRFKRRDYAAIVDRIMGRIESLERTRLELMKGDGSEASAVEPIVIEISTPTPKPGMH
ncbi:HGGxSTG domain-containing protein [Brachymonas wangyanguii]|uniref:HGGxSTG domain-containing protein n=1 Tax=Brachymonas wangyanguii TaxID=3130163 RepID=UPI00307D77F7